MPLFRTLTLTSVLALSTGPALADLTAAEVWGEWQSTIESYGMDATFDRTSNTGSGLDVIGLSMGFSLPEGDVSFDVGTINFNENGDGSVTIEMADEVPLVANFKGDDGEEGTVTVNLNQPDASITASGSADELRYVFDYPLIEISDFDIEAEDVPQDLPLDLVFVMRALKGSMDITKGDTRSFTTESAIDAIEIAFSFFDPSGEEGNFEFDLSMNDLSQTGSGTIGQVEMDMSLGQMVQGGTTQKGTGTHGAVAYSIGVDSPDGSFQFAATAASGEIWGGYDETGLAYGTLTNDAAMTIGGSTIPFPPLTFTMAKTSAELAMPIIPSEEPQDFALGFSILGMEIDNMIWGMIDAGGALPRDPINFVFKGSGAGVMSEDFMAPDYLENPSPEVPGTLESVNVDELKLTIAGAELTGDGAFTFDNSTEMPVPAGVANLMLTGGNGLLDKLVGMGLVPEEQAMGARMMLGLFARPGAGEDTLESTIELKEDGSILANGQRIR
ncbi:MAG: DUF2125 domain-containing protein [Boseongicola sp.]|nr:DUF2125 domain-containing protein [Boseongicola sp.]